MNHISERLGRLAHTIEAAETLYRYDPEHTHRPRGFGWDRTERGWTRRESPLRHHSDTPANHSMIDTVIKDRTRSIKLLDVQRQVNQARHSGHMSDDERARVFKSLADRREFHDAMVEGGDGSAPVEGLIAEMMQSGRGVRQSLIRNFVSMPNSVDEFVQTDVDDGYEYPNRDMMTWRLGETLAAYYYNKADGSLDLYDGDSAQHTSYWDDSKLPDELYQRLSPEDREDYDAIAKKMRELEDEKYFETPEDYAEWAQEQYAD